MYIIKNNIQQNPWMSGEDDDTICLLVRWNKNRAFGEKYEIIPGEHSVGYESVDKYCNVLQDVIIG